MPMRNAISLRTLIEMLCASSTGARALDESKYPDWEGQWARAYGAESAPWGLRKPDAHKPDAHKPWGLGQQPPSIPEYQAPFRANLRQVAAGVKASDATTRCIPAVAPCAMMAHHPMEIVIMPATSDIPIETFPTPRRIFTVGRAWPNEGPRSMMADRRTTSSAPTGS
jgi:hypothetical protein